jgi:hypothetical protein
MKGRRTATSLAFPNFLHMTLAWVGNGTRLPKPPKAPSADATATSIKLRSIDELQSRY